MITKFYHYLYYCYYNLVSGKSDHREDGASTLLSVLGLSIILSIYLHLSIVIGRRSLIPTTEGLGVFFLGVVLGILNWIYFIKKKNYLAAINYKYAVPKNLTIINGILLIILPLALFIFSGIKMSQHLRKF
jgi:hypothetical protein